MGVLQKNYVVLWENRKNLGCGEKDLWIELQKHLQPQSRINTHPQEEHRHRSFVRRKGASERVRSAILSTFADGNNEICFYKDYQHGQEMAGDWD
jgi:hypothetical protein